MLSMKISDQLGFGKLHNSTMKILATSPFSTNVNKTINSVRAANAMLNLQNKHAVVVGATSGIGEGIASRLAKAKVSVTVIGRNQTRGKEVVDKLTTLSGDSTSTKHEFLSCDSFSMNNIIKACDEIKNKPDAKVDILVLTQGMATTQGRTDTLEGIDQKLALHYFGRMMFIRELLPLLRQAENGKVLSVFSAGVHSPYTRYASDFSLQQYSLKDAADAAGFYNDLGLDGYSQQPENASIAFIHAAPGFVNTNWGSEMPWYLKSAVRLIQPFGRSIDDCGEVMCDPLFTYHGNGLVLIDQNANPTKVTKLHTPEAREFVFQQTMKVLQDATTKKI